MSGSTPVGGKLSAWAVNWRNPQARKNKSWENDGYLHVQGPTVTLYGEEGNKIGSKNYLKPLTEEVEFTLAGKEVRIDYSVSVQEMWSQIRGEGSSRGTPAAAPVKPGYFARPGGGSNSHSTPQQQQPQSRSTYLNKPNYQTTSLSSRNVSTSSNKTTKGDDVFRADTPELEEDDDFPQSASTSSKTWIDPKKHLQKPFKFPTPIRRTSPALEYGSHSTPSVRTTTTGSSKGGGRSRMYEEVKPESDEDEQEMAREAERQARRDRTKGGKSSRADEMARMVSEGNDRKNGKGKKVDQEEGSEEDEEEQEAEAVSEREGEDEPTPPKKRKLDPSTTSTTKETPQSTSSVRKPRVSAADLALSRSMSTKSNDSSHKFKNKPTTSSSSSSISSKPSRPRAAQSDSDTEMIQSKPEPLDSEDTNPLFLDASNYQDDFGAELEWDEGNDLNEDGLFDATSVAGSEGGGSGASETEAGKLFNKHQSKKRTSEESKTETVGGGGLKTRYFTCQWRKQSTKKNPTWEGDGILRVDKTGRAAVRDTETGKDIASAVLPKSVTFEEDKVLKIGNKEIEIGTLSDRHAYDGNDATEVQAASSSSRSKLPSSSSRPIHSIPSRPSSSTTPSLSKSFAIPSIGPKPISVSGVKTSSFYGKADQPSSTPYGPRPAFDPKKEGAIVMKRPDEEHQTVYNKKKHPVVDVVIDPKIGDALRPHQKEGVKFMYECAVGMSTKGQGCILADEMGLGKTIQSVALIWTLLKQNPYFSGGMNRAGVIERAMIVCPVTLMKNWASEIKKWLGPNALRVMVAEGSDSVKTFANSKSYQVLIVGYEKLTSSIEHIKYAQPPVGLIICDEGHRLKSSGTKTAKALSSLSCIRRVILSGTPIQNNLQEFFAMMDFVNPGLMQDAAYFKRNYEGPILKSRKAGASKEDKRAGKEASESLAFIQRNFFLRRTSDILRKHLPPKFEYTVFIVPTRREVGIYERILDSSSVRSLLSGNGRSEQLGLLTMLRKCATTPGLLMQHAKSKNQEEKGQHSIFQPDLTDLFPNDVPYSDFSLSGKLLALGVMLKELYAETDEKIVVVSNFTQTLDIIEKHCKKLKYPICRLDGKTPQAERMGIVNSFNRQDRKRQFIFLLSSKSGGTGLNIIGASRLVLLDSDWNPSTDLQAMARIHRDGQTRPCFIYRFLTSGTIDEKIYQRQITKLALSGSVMEEGDAASDSKKGDAFTVDDLKNIFRLHTDTACQTHDLLDCGCHRGENPDLSASQEQDDDDDDDDEDDSEAEEDEDEFQGFVPASQFRGESVDKRAIKKAHRNLSILKTWNHFDCSDWGKTQSFVADEFLRNLIFKLYSQVEQDERVLQSVSQMTSQERLRAERGDRTEIRGGQIGWVFEKKNEETGKKNKVEGEEEEEDEDDNGGEDRLDPEQGVMDDSDEGEY